MINQLRFLVVVCLLVVILGTPYTLWVAANGNIIFAAVCGAAVIVAFICFVIARRTVQQMKEIQYREVDDDIKPV